MSLPHPWLQTGMKWTLYHRVSPSQTLLWRNGARRSCQLILVPIESASLRFVEQGSRANKSVLHRSRKIEKVTEGLKTVKKTLVRCNPSQFFYVLRAHNKCLNTQQSYVHAKDLRCQERTFWENLWSSAKKACKSLGGDVEPSFGASEAYTHFANITKGTNSRYNTPENPGLPLWIDEVMPFPDLKKITSFDLSAITPGSIKRILNSSPGDVGITYHNLKKRLRSHEA